MHFIGKGMQKSSLHQKILMISVIKNHLQQSMNGAGCPYDNAPVESFYNKLKNEYFNLYSFHSPDELDRGIYEFVYVKYNHVRLHSYNGGRTPYAARCAA